MHDIQYSVTTASSTAVTIAFGLGDDALNGPPAYTSYSFGYSVTYSKLGCADHHLTDVV